jgi:hypothetical protein
MEKGTLLLLILIGAATICVIMYLLTSKKSKEEIELEERLEDETLLVGDKSVTLEEAENGTIVGEEFRIKTVAEIERQYEGHEREAELIYRDLDVLDKWANEEEAQAIVERAEQFKEYIKCEIAAVSYYRPNVIMGLITIHYEYSIGKTTRQDIDLQPLYIIKGSTELKRFKTISEVIVEQVGDNIVIRHPKKAKQIMFRHIAMEIDKLLYIDTFR